MDGNDGSRSLRGAAHAGNSRPTSTSASSGRSRPGWAVRRAWDWLRERWRALLVGAALLLGVELARRGRVLRTLRDEVALMRARKKIDELRALRQHAEELGSANGDVLRALDEEIRAQRIAAVRAYEEGAALTGAELERAFAELGF